MIVAPAFAQRDIQPVARELPEFVPGSMWVKLDARQPQSHDATMGVVRALAGVKQTKTFWLVPGLHLVRVPVGDERAFVSLLSNLEGVEWTSVESFGTTTQTGSCRQASQRCDDANCTDQYWVNNVNLDLAWARIENTQLPDVVVAVIDTGVNYNHPELIDNMWVNPDEVPANGLDDDSNGIIDDVHGAAFVSLPLYIDPCNVGTCAWEAAICGSCQPNVNDPQDATQGETQAGQQFCDDDSATLGGLHGTACAAIMASAANNNDIRGVACNIKIMALRVYPRCFDLDYNFTESSWVEAIQYSAAEGASVISNSLQLATGAGSGLALQNAIKNLAYSDVVFVTSAGNRSANVDDPLDPNAAFVYTPQRYVRDHVIHVGASNASDARASFSNWGPTTVDVFAPGVDIRVYDDTALEGGTGFINGTSFSTPIVAGAVALYRSLNPSVGAADVVLRVKSTARPVAALNGLCESDGVLDVDALIAP
jgi:subtilisin family serine protease